MRFTCRVIYELDIDGPADGIASSLLQEPKTSNSAQQNYRKEQYSVFHLDNVWSLSPIVIGKH